MAEKFYWDNPSTALHLQTSIPLKVQVGAKVFATKSWSLSGFRLINFHAKQTELIGKTFPATLQVHFRDFNISIDTVAVVKEYSLETQELEAEFKVLKEEHKELLRYFIQSIVSGEMASIDNIIRRVDMPVESPTIKIPTAEASAKTGIISMSSLYWLAGLLLLGYLLFSLYSSSYRMEISSAVVSRKVLTVQSSVNGTITKLGIKAGETVQAGAVLASIMPAPLENIADTPDNSAQSYESSIQEVQELLTIQDKKLSTYHKEAQADTQQAMISYEAAKNRLTLAQGNVDRMQKLFTQGIISAMTFKKHQEELLKNQEDVAIAKIELSKKQDVLDNVNNGYLYNGKNLDNEREKLLAKLNNLQHKQQLAQGNAENTIKPLPGTASIKSPVNGILKEWLVDESQYLHSGQNVAKLIDTSENQYIEAFLTQEEVGWVGLNAAAVAYIPAIDRSLPVYVSYLDRTNGFFEEVNNRFDWRNPEEKTAKVKLEFTAPPSEEVTAGLPVIINFSKNNKTSAGIFSWVWDFFKPAPEQATEATKVAATACKNSLWPEAFIPSPNSQALLPKALLENLIAKADAALTLKPQALSNLNSSGVIDPDDKDLLKTRESLQDSQRSALLAITYKLTGQQPYFKQAKAILLAWAQTYKPSGNPIDETKLDYMLWAYDLVQCELSADENKMMESWLKDIQDKKNHWSFGESSAMNNWKTHQLKMQLMLDKLLDDPKAWDNDIQATQQHLAVNILKNGSTFDYEERNALHYHVYDLEAWSEIALLDPDYLGATKKAFDFLITKIENDEIHDQFTGSKQAIDAKRANAGFEYAQQGSSYPVEKAARLILSYATASHIPLQQAIPPRHAKVFTEDVFDQALFTYIRYYLWRNKDE